MSGPNDKLPTREQIEKRAFEIYVERGSEKGSELSNWAAAEKELMQLSGAPEKPLLSNTSGERPKLRSTSMFLDFFGLREEPFGMTPDPAYLYASGTHRDALAALKFGIAENRGFFALIAQPGMGKTTLLYRLLEEMQDSARTVLVSQTQCNSRELIAYILHELGVEVEGLGLVSLHGKLNEILFNELLAGKRFVLVVDEAQNLDDTVLETVRMLSNFETHNAKLVQIILAGQPRLAAKLAQPRLIQLRQRIAVLSHLEPFTAQETAGYIAHRLTIAGHSGEPVFDSAALDEIARQSDGIPRNINNICFNSMLMSFNRGQRTVTSEIVRRAVASLDLEALIPEPVKVKHTIPTLPASPVSVPEAAPVSAPQESVAPEPAPEISTSNVAVPVVTPVAITAASVTLPEEIAAWVPHSIPAPVTVPASTAPLKTISKPPQVPVKQAPVNQAPFVVPPKKVHPSIDFISYDANKKINWKRWQIRSVIVTAILLSAILALAILGRSQSKRGIGLHSFDSTSGSIGSLIPSGQSENASSNYDAEPMETNNGEILTVAASANQSIRDLSMRYAGRFDIDIFRKICVLNPDLIDPDHLEAGQLIRIPLPPGTIRKMNDTAEAQTRETEKSGGLLSKFTDILGGKK
jgi:type II secretory pathway predicted ATPase ExeA